MAAKNAPAKAYKAGQEAIQLGDYKSAQTSFLWAATLEPDNPLYMHAAAGATSRMGKYREAEGMYRKAISCAERTMGRGQPRAALIAYSLIEMYDNQGRVDESRQLSQRVVTGLDREEAVHANSQTVSRLAEMFRRAGMERDAEALCRDALAWRERIHRDDREKLADFRVGLAAFLEVATAPGEACIA